MKKKEIEEINTAFQNFETALSAVRLTVAESASVLRSLDTLRTTLNQNLVLDETTTPNPN